MGQKSVTGIFTGWDKIALLGVSRGGTKKCYWDFHGMGQNSVTGNFTGWDKKVLLGVSRGGTKVPSR